jgi:hypothetical protein
MNVAITYKENGVPGNVQSQLGHLKRYKSDIIVYVENDEPYNKRQHVHSLFLAMTHCNCLETKMHQPQDDGIVEKWILYVDSTMQKCGSKNDWQSRATITHNFLCVAKMAKFYCRVFL